MPSSLVFAALVVAWLAVLVPVVARRRQMVPRPAEAHLSSRVLARPERSVVGRPAVTVALPSAVAVETTPDTAPTEDAENADATGADAPQGRVLDRGRGRRPVRDDAGEDEGMDVRDDEERLVTEGYDDGYGPDADLDREDERGADAGPDHRPRSYRPGRGGFDADAAVAAAHARYAFRQRVAIGLVAIAVLSLLAALVVSPVLWWLHVVTDLGLIGYLVFLRRQTRIEDEVRRRRLARLTGERRALEARRDRQAEHEARLAEVQGWASEDELDDSYDDEAGYDEAGDDEHEDLDVPAPRWIAPRSPSPVVPEGMELVADTDEDPAFHELSDARVPSYRRLAAGA